MSVKRSVSTTYITTDPEQLKMWRYSSVLLFLASYVCMAQGTSSNKATSSSGEEKYDTQCCKEHGLDCRIYTFGFSDIPAFTVLNNGVISGPSVEIARKVCETAKKTCEMAYLAFSRNWGNDDRSDALDGRWYDFAVVGHSRRREGPYQYVNYGLGGLGKPLIITKTLENDTLEDLKEVDINRTVATMSNAKLNTRGILAQYLADGYKVEEGKVVHVGDIDPAVAVGKIIDMLDKGQVDFGIIIGIAIPDDAPAFEVVTKLSDNFKGDGDGMYSLMLRKDATCVKNWWDKAYLKFRCSADGRTFCDNLNIQYTATEHCFPVSECP